MSDLKSRWIACQKESPHIRIRDAAQKLDTSEAALLSTQLGDCVTRLRPDWYDMLMEMESFGEVMALTRNDVFVHEKVGRYSNASVIPDHKMGQTLDKNIDLRIFFRNWFTGFAVTKTTDDGKVKRSLQYFDRFGNAVHKTHFRPASNYDALDAFISKYRATDQSEGGATFERLPPAKQELPDEEIDKTALQDTWSALRDTHDFIFMLRKFKVSREQAFRIAGPEFARPVPTSSFDNILEAAAASDLSIMVFVNNPGCTQIHSGPINRIKVARGWYNILDPGFSLHVKHKEIARTWIVKKPVDKGVVHSLECFDEAGTVLCYVFGKRKEGQHENEIWRGIVQGAS